MAAPEFTKAVRNWENSMYEVKRLEKKLKQAISEEKVHASFLGNLIAPSDIKHDEKVCVWVRINSEQERIVESTCVGPNLYVLNFRGDSKSIKIE